MLYTKLGRTEEKEFSFFKSYCYQLTVRNAAPRAQKAISLEELVGSTRDESVTSCIITKRKQQWITTNLKSAQCAQNQTAEAFNG